MPGKILVVDDVATNRIILRAKLSVSCYDVLQAGDGHEALILARRERPDLILLDLSMPGMSGLDVLAELKSCPETASIAVVVVTSRADARSRIAALKAGAEDFLTKPVDDSELAARVRALLRTRLLTEELELREGTSQALGFSEIPTTFDHARASVSEATLTNNGKQGPGRIALVSVGEPDVSWAEAVSAHSPHRLDWVSRTDLMRTARAPLGGSAAASWTQNDPPEVIVIACGPEDQSEALLLLSELRASPGTCHAAILVAMRASDGRQIGIALDLGASDVMTLPLDAEECALRLSLQLARARQMIRLRRRLRDGLHLAVTDPLTGLPNRRYGLSHLERMFERAVQRGEPLAALMLDLDHFKEVNDLYGHAAGDAVLRSVSARLQAQLRGGDLLARIGGEEFVLIMSDVDATDALLAADRLRRAIDDVPIPLPPPPGPPPAGPHRNAIARPTVELHQTVSIGVARGPNPEEARLAQYAGPASAARALMERADAALFRAKSDGRNCVVDSTRGRSNVAA